ncbi:hypothetical protein HanPI659440_Chr17g0667521 [Helianthus annuus]|nr:hypothetical protein HanPI659440_Chr17g0667521 [Helianthus annuus]
MHAIIFTHDKKIAGKETYKARTRSSSWDLYSRSPSSCLMFKLLTQLPGIFGTGTGFHFFLFFDTSTVQVFTSKTPG